VSWDRPNYQWHDACCLLIPLKNADGGYDFEVAVEFLAAEAFLCWARDFRRDFILLPFLSWVFILEE